MKNFILLFFIFTANLALSQQDDYNYRNANQNMMQGNYKIAIDYYNLFLSQYTNFAKAYQERGQCYTNLGQYQNAYNDYSEAIRLMPMNSEFYINRGYCNMFLGFPQQALDDFNHAIIYGANNNTGAYIGRANAYLDLDNLGLALTDINSAISLSPNDGRNLVVRAEIYGLMNDTNRMLQDLYVISTSYPDAIYADVKTYTLALIYDNATRDINFLNVLLLKEPDNFFILLRRGFDYYILKNFDSAKENFETAFINYKNNSETAAAALKNLISRCDEYKKK